MDNGVAHRELEYILLSHKNMERLSFVLRTSQPVNQQSGLSLWAFFEASIVRELAKPSWDTL